MEKFIVGCLIAFGVLVLCAAVLVLNMFTTMMDRITADEAWWFMLIGACIVAIVIAFVWNRSDTNRRRQWDVEDREFEQRQIVQNRTHSDINGLVPIPDHKLDNPQIVLALLQQNLAMIESRKTHPNTPNSIHYNVKNDNYGGLLEDGQPQALPFVPPSFTEILNNGMLPSGENCMLGFRQDGSTVIKSIQDIGSAVLVGGSGSGKSTMTRFILAQMKGKNCDVFVIDPEYGVGEESLAESIESLGLAGIAVEDEQITELVRYVADEATSKRQRDRRILLVVDEVTDLLEKSEASDDLLAAIKAVNRKGRKRGVYILCIGQDISSKAMDTGGRNVFASIISMPTLRGALGTAVPGHLYQIIETLPEYHALIYRPGKEFDVFSIPNTTQDDIELFVNSSGSYEANSQSTTPSTNSLPMLSTTDDSVDGDGRLSVDGVVDTKRAQILCILKDGGNMGDISRRVYQTEPEGGKYTRLKAEVHTIIVELINENMTEELYDSLDSDDLMVAGALLNGQSIKQIATTVSGKGAGPDHLNALSHIYNSIRKMI